MDFLGIPRLSVGLRGIAAVITWGSLGFTWRIVVITSEPAQSGVPWLADNLMALDAARNSPMPLSPSDVR
jgi:hypothetical protein